MSVRDDSSILREDGDVKVYRGSGKGKKASPPPRRPEQRRSKTEEKKPRRRREPKRKAFSPKDLRSPILAAVLAVVVYFLPTEGWIRALSFALPWLLAGFPQLMGGIERLVNRHSLGGELVVILGSLVAYALGDYVGAVAAVLALSLAEVFDNFAATRSQDKMDELMSIRPEDANVETAEGVLNVTPDYVNPGDVIVVYPGERIPLDGRILEGITAIDTSVLTGRSEPVAVSPGSRAVSGCRNITSLIKIQVTSSWEDSTVTRILDMVEAAPSSKPRIERYSRRFSKLYPPALLALSLAVAIVPTVMGGDWREYLSRAAAMMAAGGTGCFVMSSVAAYMAGLCSAMKNGVIIKGFDSLEALGQTDTLVFDKTGIVTEGRISITEVCPEGMGEEELLAIATTAETGSHHPVAKALRQVSSGVELPPGLVPEVVTVPGRGVRAMIGDKQVLVGNAALLEEAGIGYKVPSRSGAAIHVAVDRTYCGHFMVADRIKRGAFDALEGLRVSGAKKLVLLTGDVLSVAKPVASKLNFDMLKAEQSPEDKAASVEYLIKNKGGVGRVAFVGDGLNDVQALSKADVGITMGALESLAAIQAGDVVLMDDDIGKLPVALRTVRMADLSARISAGAALAVKGIVLLAGALGGMPVVVAACLDGAIHILAVANALRAGKAWKER